MAIRFPIISEAYRFFIFSHAQCPMPNAPCPMPHALWKISIEASSLVEQEDRELIMQLSQAYLEWEQKTKRSGIEQGQRQVVENLLKVRFGELDKQLLAIIEPMLQLPPQEYSSLLLQLSREELLKRFS